MKFLNPQIYTAIESFLTMTILHCIIRIIGLFVCKKKAIQIGRNSYSWGFLGFISPIISMIWINSLKPKSNFKMIGKDDN